MIAEMLLIGVVLNIAFAGYRMKFVARTKMDILIIMLCIILPYIVFFIHGMMWLLDRLLELFCKVINWLNEDL